ncbi:MAG: SRPBCC domain-containing protein [Archangiaceae bacterium]|nr:SRPBCC domain-containing protein [Archangiaceae bacterium]
MKKALMGVAVLVGVLALGGFIAVQTATVVRQLRPHGELKANGVAEKTRTADALDYSVAIQIAAPPAIVWALLTDAKGYPQWNSTVVKLDGTIAKGELIQLVAKVAPERTFSLKVSELEKPLHLVWEDGGKAFSGVRTFTLTPGPDGASTVFAMSETLSGRMLPMIEGSLPDFTPEFNGFARDLKVAAEKVAPPQ